MLFGCYRKGEAEDPDTYAAAVAAVLAAYPTPIVYRVTDPLRGLPGRSRWLPTVAEVRDACEMEMAPQRASEARQKRIVESRKYLRSDKPERRDVPARIRHLVLGKREKSAEPFCHTEEWLADYGRAPLTVSDRLRKRLALAAHELS